ncbi:PIN domain-containing protein, partial [Candidatus Hakubella thermalkaliphila]
VFRTVSENGDGQYWATDDLKKQAEAAALFEQVKARKLRVVVPHIVIADAFYVLSSPRLYNLPRLEIARLLAPLIRLPGFKVRHRRAMLRALELYASTNLDFGDALIVALMEGTDARV